MTLVLQQLRLCLPGHPLHGKPLSLLIENGKIAQISTEPLPEKGKTVQGKDWWVSLGWADMQAVLCEPGYEHKETLRSMALAAASGGFTDVAVLPNTKPVIQTKESVEFVRNRSQYLPTRFHVMAALSKDNEGQEMTEILDLHYAGAVAFTDGLKPLNRSSLISRSLQYISQFGGLLVNLPDDRDLSAHGQMHEGEISTLLGLKGIPTLAEELAIQRDLALLPFSGGRLHFSAISAAESVQRIRKAKQKGLAVTCGVTVANLFFTDQDLLGFDTNLKISPPLRTETDRFALWEGLRDGTIDVIITDHHPQDIESKELEFDLADVGMIGFETAFAALCTQKPADFPLDLLIEKMTVSPRKILGLSIPALEIGEKACLTVFDPIQEWEFGLSNIKSASRNPPFIGKALKGKAILTINGEFVTDP
jgi:dihydroorotase